MHVDWWKALSAAGVLLALLSCADSTLGRCGEQRCAENQRCDQAASLCVLDEAPTVTLTSPTANAQVRDAFVRVTGYASDDVKVTTLQVSTDDGGSWRPLTLGANGAFDAEVGLPAADAVAVVLTVRALDEKQQAGVAKTTLQVDDVDPLCTLVAPAVTGQVGPSSIEVHYADGSGAAANAESSVDGTTFTPVALDGGSGRFEWVVPAANGFMTTLAFRASDSSGHRCLATAAVRVDTEPPAIAISSPAPGALLGIPFFAGQRMKVTASDGPNALKAVWFEPGAGPRVAATAVGDGGWEASIPVPTPALNGAAQTWRATAEDLGGNRTTAQVSVTVDTVPPSVSIPQPAAGALLGPGAFGVSGVTVQVNADDDVNAVGTVELDLATGTFAPATAQGVGSWVAKFLKPTADYEDRVLVARATDLAGNVAQASRTVKVDTVAPVVTINVPTAGQKFNIASFASGNGVQVGWTMTDGDGAAKSSWNGVVARSPILVTTSSTENGVDHSVVIEATDSAGNLGSATATFSVDRVAPTIAATSPADDARHVAPAAAVTFSEVMSAASPGLAVSPTSGTGTWTTPSTFTVAGLGADAVSTASTLTPTDTFGNPLAASHVWKFHTRPALPPDGTTLATQVGDFRVAADEDGVLTWVTRKLGGGPFYETEAFSLDAKTGAVVTIPHQGTNSAQPARLHATAWAVMRSDLTAERTRAGTFRFSPLGNPLTTTDKIDCLTDSAAACSAQALAGLVAIPPVVGETATERFGFLSAASYTRGASTFPTHIAAPTFIGLAPRHFALYDASSTPNRRDTFRCVKAIISPFATTCALEVEDLADTGPASELTVAEGSPCTFLAYDSSTQGRVLDIRAVQYQDCGALGCPPATVEAVGASHPQLRVASASELDSTLVVAAWVPTTGNIQLGTRSVSASCTGGSWSSFRSPIATTSPRWEPVSLAGEPALVVLEGSTLVLRRP